MVNIRTRNWKRTKFCRIICCLELPGGDSLEDYCENDLQVVEDESVIFTICRGKEIAPAITSRANVLEVRVTGRSDSLIPKRGVLLYYTCKLCNQHRQPARWTVFGILRRQETRSAMHIGSKVATIAAHLVVTNPRWWPTPECTNERKWPTCKWFDLIRGSIVNDKVRRSLGM